MSIFRRLKGMLDPRVNLDRLPRLQEGEWEMPAMGGNRLRLSHILTNFPLMLGGAIVLGLFLLVLFGPMWAPINPYIAGQHVVAHADPVSGEWIQPPLAPSRQYPLGTDQWGNDILSMLMYGARNTLIAGAFITMVRILLGLILGSLAGWHEGSTLDRFIMSFSGVSMSVPVLISSMILIYALDIRRGLPVFIIALSVVGWTETAQYIRSELLVIRKMPYIEGAEAVGSGGMGIIVRHALPNLLPQLLVLLFLEFGAVLMIVGELAFIGVFIGGGSRIAIGDEIAGAQVTLAEVPEWGAMLAEGYRWLMSKPFIVFPPAMAFFTAVVGFNTFGEGLRRLMDKLPINTSFLLRKRMILVIVMISAATAYIISNTGPAPWFAKMAQAFAGDEALVHTQVLSEMEGRSVLQPGGQAAAAYISQIFQEYGLTPGWRHQEFVYPMEMNMTRLLSQPELSLVDSEGNIQQGFTHQLDFGFTIEGHGGGGLAELPLTYVGFDSSVDEPSWEAFQGLDLRQRIVLLVSGNAPQEFAAEALIRGAKGILWVTGDGRDDVRSGLQFADAEGDYMRQPRIPIFRIRPGTADLILSAADLSLADLFRGDVQSQSGPGWSSRDLDQLTVRMSLELAEPEIQQVPTVLGYLPGSDLNLDGELVVIFAHYDGLGRDPDGTIFPGANHNASGISILLETARLWQEQDLEPRRPVLFAAWGGGALDNPGASAFLSNPNSFRHLPTTVQLQPVAVFQLDNVGAGGDEIYIHPDSSGRLTRLLQDTAGELDLVTTQYEKAATDPKDLLQIREPWIYLSWAEAERLPQQDSIEKIDPDKLRKMGELFSLSLAKIVRQVRY